MTLTAWLAELDKLGISEGVFDSASAQFTSKRTSNLRRPYINDDGCFTKCYREGMTPVEALDAYKKQVKQYI